MSIESEFAVHRFLQRQLPAAAFLLSSPAETTSARSPLSLSIVSARRSRSPKLDGNIIAGHLTYLHDF